MSGRGCEEGSLTCSRSSRDDQGRSETCPGRESTCSAEDRRANYSGQRHPPDDAVQEAYLKALRAIESGNFPQERGHLLAWFTRVVYSVAYDSLRGHARRKDRGTGVPDREAADVRPGPLDRLIQREDDDRVERELALLPGCIGRLPEAERKAVELRFQGVTNRKIALALGIPPGSVSALFRSVYEKLKQSLAMATRP
jgi:RNA polymerase sigma factor (sigma-70 family)